MTKEQEEQSFRVTDKRGFREDGETVAPENAEKSGEKTAAPPPLGTDAASHEIPPRPPIDFTSYLLTCYYQGLASLGVPNPATDNKEGDLEAAQSMIDLLAMIEQKTKGNLSNVEQKLLEDVLYELRMMFMAKTNRIKY
jgi:hypothetical protein